MATQLFKDGESTYVKTDAVQRHIAAGWSPVDPDAPSLDLSIVMPPNRHIGSIKIPDGADEVTAENAALMAMGVHSDKPVIGATHVAV